MSVWQAFGPPKNGSGEVFYGTFEGGKEEVTEWVDTFFSPGYRQAVEEGTAKLIDLQPTKVDRELVREIKNSLNRNR